MGYIPGGTMMGRAAPAQVSWSKPRLDLASQATLLLRFPRRALAGRTREVMDVYRLVAWNPV